jgi:hypothetical protein
MMQGRSARITSVGLLDGVDERLVTAFMNNPGLD